MQKDDPSLGAVILSRGLENVHQLHQRDVETENRVATAEPLVRKEVISNQPLLVVDVLGLSVAEDHLVDPLECGAGDLWILSDDLKVIFERALPIQLGVALRVLECCDFRDPRCPFCRFLHFVSLFVRSFLAEAPPLCGTAAGWDRAKENIDGCAPASTTPGPRVTLYSPICRRPIRSTARRWSVTRGEVYPSARDGAVRQPTPLQQPARATPRMPPIFPRREASLELWHRRDRRPAARSTRGWRARAWPEIGAG